jgi:SAM-dependent methyltransferase
MGYVFDFHDAKSYARWFNDPRNSSEAELECKLMLDMLCPVRDDSVLEIGCGTGASLIPLLDRGLNATGIDPSPYMLDIALQNLGHRVDLYRGYAENLPFDDNSFNHACFMTALEFVDDPQKAIAEACRVAKDRVFIGVLNRYAIKSIQRRLAGIFNATIYNHAKFFGVWELKRIVRTVVGPVPLTWRTVNQFPASCSGFTHNLEHSSIVQRCPFGAFAGMVVTLIPRFRTRPLAMRYQRKRTTGAVTG